MFSAPIAGLAHEMAKRFHAAGYRAMPMTGNEQPSIMVGDIPHLIGPVLLASLAIATHESLVWIEEREAAKAKAGP